jgi:hypothetical protein
MVWMAKGAHVIEMNAGGNFHYQHWASLLGHNYYRIKGEALADVLLGILSKM